MLPEECAAWIEYAEGIGFTDVYHAATSEYAHRDNGRIQYTDTSLAESIYDRIAPLLPPSVDGLSPCGCSSNIRLYRYRPGQSFGRHVDESHASPEGVSKYTLLIYLNGDDTKMEDNDSSKSVQRSKRKKVSVAEAEGNREAADISDCQQLRGGYTLFYRNMYGRDPVVSVQPVEGRLLFHGHGDRCLTHEGDEVLSGVKYLLRTDVLYK